MTWVPRDAPLPTPRPEDPLPGDTYLIHPLVVTRRCFYCARPERHRQVWDYVWGRILLRCLRCHHEAEAVMTGGPMAGPERRPS